MNRIIIIGTNPPCPRCGLLTRVVTEKVTQMGIKAPVIHINYTDKAAADFAKGLYLEAGTAKEVAERTGIGMDPARVRELIEKSNPDPDCDYKDYNDYNWSGELDEYLRPFELKARDAGILMTPVLIISKIIKCQVKIIKSPEASPSFSFFNYVFINTSLPEDQWQEILNHETAYVSQKHWIDLVLTELLCTIQWINPLAWMWARFVRQNHEYLADRSALRHSADPVVYMATLLNHLLGYQVLTLSNSFNQSINKKRFDMMKQKISSPYRKMRVLFVLPVITLLMYAFAEPAYHYISAGENSQQVGTAQQTDKKVVRGRVLGSDGPLAGAMVLVTGTNIGTITDNEGNYMIIIPDGTTVSLTFAANGYQRYGMSRDFVPFDPDNPSVMVIDMTLEKDPEAERQLPEMSTRETERIVTDDDESVLYLIDGEIIENYRPQMLKPSDIKSISVLKSREAINTYGTANNYGLEGITSVIIIETKKAD